MNLAKLKKLKDLFASLPTSPTTLSLGLTSKADNNIAFELYALAALLDHLSGAYVVQPKRGDDSGIPPYGKFVYRRNQSGFKYSTSAYSFFHLIPKTTGLTERRQKAKALEIHNRLKILGVSEQPHEQDVAVLHRSETRFTQTPKLEYADFRALAIGMECKNYGANATTEIDIGLGREMLGLQREMGGKPIVLVTKKPQVTAGVRKLVSYYCQQSFYVVKDFLSPMTRTFFQRVIDRLIKSANAPSGR